MELEGHSLQSQTDGGSKNLLLFAGGIAALNGFAQANAACVTARLFCRFYIFSLQIT